ncbi:hypothetical protein R6Q59_035319 [Mikania micrantha]
MGSYRIKLQSFANLCFLFAGPPRVTKIYGKAKTKKGVDTFSHADHSLLYWKARNDAMFNHRKVSKEKIVEDIKTLSYFWVKLHTRSCGLDWASWLSFNVG